MGGGLRPPPTPRLFLSRAKRASKPMNLVETHHVSIVLQMGGVFFLGKTKKINQENNKKKSHETHYESYENMDGM